MSYPTKIATCCHCGTKAALLLDQTHHVLACSSCGAPLRDLKMVPRKRAAKPAVTHQPQVRSFAVPARKVDKTKLEKARVEKVKVEKKRHKPKKSKKRKGWFGEKFKDMAEDLFDVVEDIFD